MFSEYKDVAHNSLKAKIISIKFLTKNRHKSSGATLGDFWAVGRFFHKNI
jgi:hypothetical protein